MLDTKGWSYEGWYDLQPEAGAFLAPVWSDYTIHGETIHAANWCHAEYLWLRKQLEKNGDEWGRCCHCNHSIRYAVTFHDATGKLRMVGQDCAAFISSQLPRDQWKEKQLMSEIKEKDTKNGKRCVLTMPAPQWFWNLTREQRPAFTSVFKGAPMGRQRKSPWYLSIWGQTQGEVIANYEALRKLRDNPAAAPTREVPPPAKPARRSFTRSAPVRTTLDRENEVKAARDAVAREWLPKWEAFQKQCLESKDDTVAMQEKAGQLAKEYSEAMTAAEKAVPPVPAARPRRSRPVTRTMQDEPNPDLEAERAYENYCDRVQRTALD